MNYTQFIPSNNQQINPQLNNTMTPRMRQDSQERISTYSKSSTIRKYNLQAIPNAQEQIRRLPNTLFYDHQRSTSLSQIKHQQNVKIETTKSVSNFQKVQGISFAQLNDDEETNFIKQAKSYDNISIQSAIVQNVQADIIISNTLTTLQRIKQNPNDILNFQKIEQNLKTLKNLFVQMKADKKKLEEIVQIQKKRLQYLTYSKPSSYFMEKYETLYERYDVLRRQTGINPQTMASTIPPNILQEQLIEYAQQNDDQVSQLKSPRNSVKSEFEQQLVIENKQLKTQIEKLKKNNVNIMDKLNEQLEQLENKDSEVQKFQNQINILKSNNSEILVKLNELTLLNSQKDQLLLKERKSKSYLMNQNMKLNKEIKSHLDKLIKNRAENVELQNNLVLSLQDLPAINSLKQLQDKFVKAQSLKDVNYFTKYNKNKYLDLQIKYQILLNQYIEIYSQQKTDVDKKEFIKKYTKFENAQMKNVLHQNELIKKQLKNQQNINKNLQFKIQNILLQEAEFFLYIIEVSQTHITEETYNQIITKKKYLKDQKDLLTESDQVKFVQIIDQIDNQLDQIKTEDKDFQEITKNNKQLPKKLSFQDHESINEQYNSKKNEENSDQQSTYQRKVTNQTMNSQDEQQQDLNVDNENQNEYKEISQKQLQTIQEVQIDFENLYKEKLEFLKKDNEESWQKYKQLREEFFQLESENSSLKNKNKTYWQILEDRNKQIKTLETDYEEQANFILEENVTDEKLKEEIQKELENKI